MIGLALLSVLLVGASVALVVRALSLPRVRSERVLDQIKSYGFTQAGTVVVDAPSGPSPVEMLGMLIAPRLGPARFGKVHRMLIGAGLHRTSVERYLGWSAVSAVVIPLLLIYLTASSGADPFTATFEVLVGIGMGVLVPQAILSRRARMRSTQIDHEMPELVDLLLVAVEGGMGFNGAVRAASQRIEGPLGEELMMMMQQQSLGASTADALQNMLDRCDTPSVRSFVGTIVQGERLGVSIGNLMRTLADEMRKQRIANAEEVARKVPIKILFPLVFMILPAMIIVVLAPAVANISSALSGI